ncbi:MAG: HesA/MoeB/ThiF family protein [Sphingobacteriales bacterium]|nr:MAG: HesA/MoeB/ThiF family protein [Sphingobacteriales bacterium]
MVPEVGTAGQKLLAQAKVLIVGAGGLGSPLAAMLVASGLGTVGIADRDTVEESNLSRQYLFDEKDRGKHKALQLATRLREQNPSVSIIPIVKMLTMSDAPDIIASYDIVCDCTDNLDARRLIDRICGELRKPLVYAAVRDWQGYAAVFHHTRNKSFEDAFGGFASQNDTKNCALSGIMNPTCGIAASLQCAEVIKIVLGLPSDLDGGLLCFNILNPLFRLLKL